MNNILYKLALVIAFFIGAIFIIQNFVFIIKAVLLITIIVLTYELVTGKLFQK